jgi:hypothetical protein
MPTALKRVHEAKFRIPRSLIIPQYLKTENDRGTVDLQASDGLGIYVFKCTVHDMGAFLETGLRSCPRLPDLLATSYHHPQPMIVLNYSEHRCSMIASNEVNKTMSARLGSHMEALH